MNTKKASFKEREHSTSFNEYSLENKKNFKKGNSSTSSQSNKPFPNKRKTSYQSNTFQKQSDSIFTESRTEITMNNARGAGKVKVIVKNAEDNKSHVKKTGALSPRAPEKIKKNRAEEMKVYGENACLTLFSERPESIVRVWATVEMSHQIGHIFSYLASHKKAYHVVANQELALVSGTEHHGGICMLVKKRQPFTLDGYLAIPRKKNCLILLDGVRNSHNIGGVIRTCAFYGINGVIVSDTELLNSSSAMRVAEGGVEYVHPLKTIDSESALEKLRSQGYQIIHLTLNKQAKSLNSIILSEKVVFVLSEGSTYDLAKVEDEVVNLSYVNPIKNGLNVAVATGVLLSKWASGN